LYLRRLEVKRKRLPIAWPENITCVLDRSHTDPQDAGSDELQVVELGAPLQNPEDDPVRADNKDDSDNRFCGSTLLRVLQSHMGYNQRLIAHDLEDKGAQCGARTPEYHLKAPRVSYNCQRSAVLISTHLNEVIEQGIHLDACLAHLENGDGLLHSGVWMY
jgi:hypothetical protein